MTPSPTACADLAQESQALAHYAARVAALTEAEASFELRSRRFSRGRGVAFFISLGLAWATWSRELPTAPWLGYSLAILSFVVFVVLVGIHERLLSDLQIALQRRTINTQHRARRQHDWGRVPETPCPVAPERAALARDLDLFGKGSLFQWLSLAQTPLGQQTLRDWLLWPAPPGEVLQRQVAVQQLAPLRELREELQLRGRLVSLSGQGPGAFLEWAEGPGWLASRPALRWLTRFISGAMIAIGLLALQGTSHPVLWATGLGLLVVNLLLNVIYVPPIHQLFEIVASRQNDVAQYKAALSLFHELPGDCPKFAELRAKLGGDVDEPLRQLSRLGWRVQLAAARHSAVWGIPYVILQATLLCDFHVLSWLESWQRRHGHQARRWFEALAELEALMSLAAVAHDYPDWAFPSVSPEHDAFRAEQLGHPLIPDELRVANDVEIGPPGTFLLVSGSNMSGKSTLLRSVGINALLAQAGGPTCSRACSLPPLDVETSMRIGDSLADGVSFYMAELKRLKQIVDRALEVGRDDRLGLLFLLDEILLGTNSAERHLAVIHVVRHLLDAGAIGAISTHDLGLATSPELADACHAVHFREQIIAHNGTNQMTFDYRMRPGVATTTNALKLLELVGLGHRLEQQGTIHATDPPPLGG